jgi:hypothetical protein
VKVERKRWIEDNAKKSHSHMIMSIGSRPSYHRSLAGGMSTGYFTAVAAEWFLIRSNVAKYVSFWDHSVEAKTWNIFRRRTICCSIT